MSDQPARPKRVGLWTLVQFLIEASQRKAYLDIRVSMQAGQIGIIRVEESYKLDTLPIRDQRHEQQVERATQPLLVGMP